MPFSKCSQYPVVGRISANGIKIEKLTLVDDFSTPLRFAQNDNQRKILLIL